MSRLIDHIKTSGPILAGLILITSLFVACTQGLGNPGDVPAAGEDSVDSPSVEGQVTLSLSLPPLASPLMDALGFTGTLMSSSNSSRAMMIVQRYRVSLFDESNDQLVNERTVDADYINPGSNALDDVSFLVDPGTYYVVVDIINPHMSATEPVLQGFSQEFIVPSGGGRVDVPVTCFPVNPQSLGNEPIRIELDYMKADYITNTFEIGDEAWFTFFAEETTSRINIKYDNWPLNAMVSVFDENGAHVGEFLEQSQGNYGLAQYLDVSTTVGARYYVCAVNIEYTRENYYFNGSNLSPGADYSIWLHKVMFDSMEASSSTGSVLAKTNVDNSLMLVLADTETAYLTFDLRPNVTVAWNGVAVTGNTVAVQETGVLTFDDGFVTQTIPVSVINAEASEISETWETITIKDEAGRWFAYHMTANAHYLLEWDAQGYRRSGRYDGNCYVGYFDATGSIATQSYTSAGYGIDAKTVQSPVDTWLFVHVRSGSAGNQTCGLRVFEKVNRSPVMTSESSFSLVQMTSSYTSSRNISYSDLDGDTISASISCTAAPSDVNTASVIDSSDFYFYDSYGYVYVQRNLPAGDYTLTLVLDDGQGFDGTDGINAPSRVEIPITMSITNVVPVMALSADETVCAIGATVSLSFSVSQDPDLNSDLLAFSIQSKPEGTAATISASPFTVGTSSITGTATIAPDVAGEWVIAVTGTEASGTVSKTVTILVHDGTQGGVEFDVY